MNLSAKQIEHVRAHDERVRAETRGRGGVMCTCRTYELRTHLKATDWTGCPLHGLDLRASASPRAAEPFAMSVADAEWRRAQALIGVKDALNELRVANAQLRRARGMPA